MSGDILDISCDEAGHTGPDLLAKDQRYFAYASVAITDEEAADIIRQARKAHPVQMPELKASKLMASPNGRRLVMSVLDACKERYAVCVHDKLYALCCCFFEYIYEPVFQDDPWILYEKNMHRFVAMYALLWMTEEESGAESAITQFQKYMRSREPADAPFLFGTRWPPLRQKGTEHPFESVLRFAHGYRDIIIADNKRMEAQVPDAGKWVLDLATTSLWAHLNYWGRKGKLLSVRCDVSKPLKAMSQILTGDDNDAGIRRARSKNHRGPLGWKFAKPVAFVDSKMHPAIQVADIIAGAAVAMASSRAMPDFASGVGQLLKHALPESILPDYEFVNPANREAMVNSVILYGLATRAEVGANPHENLAEIYRAAEVSWVKGDLRIT